MMDWCCDLETEDLIVPTDEPFNREFVVTPLPNYWSNMDNNTASSDGFGWTTMTTNYTAPVTTPSENYDYHHHHHHPLDEKLQQKLLFSKSNNGNNSEPCSSQNSNVSPSSSFSGSEEAVSGQRELNIAGVYHHDRGDDELLPQFGDFSGNDQLDDIFFSLMPPQLDSNSLNMQLFSSRESSPTIGGQDLHLPVSPSNNMCQQQQPPHDHFHFQSSSKALGSKPCHPTNEISLSGGGGHDTVLEDDMVLRELVMVLSQLPERTRLCFRDSFYRLANKSGQEMPMRNKTEGPHHKISRHSSYVRPQAEIREEVMKSEKNNIDVAVANLVFNKVELNTHDIVPAMSLRSNNHHDQEFAEGSGYGSFNPPQGMFHHNHFWNDHSHGGFCL